MSSFCVFTNHLFFRIAFLSHFNSNEIGDFLFHYISLVVILLLYVLIQVINAGIFVNCRENLSVYVYAVKTFNIRVSFFPFPSDSSFCVMYVGV